MSRPQPEPEVVSALRAICLGFPEAHEESAWTGTRWRVRQQTFAHVVRIEDGWPPAYAKAAGSAGPLTVLTFRSTIAGFDPLHYAEAPFFRPVWFADIVGLRLDGSTNWAEVAGLIAASYRALAPKTLVDRL
ncbi:MAG: MmcQ/YjbR family DNA-binding protein [Caulobacteraceae bacterium]|nr:MAG: MmcQ/YjbR family DNA-binding protein [Caulobacteraceae bacterium]